MSHSTRGRILIVGKALYPFRHIVVATWLTSLGWYRELMDGQQPSWRAKDQQFLQSGQAQPTQDDQPQAANEDLPKD